MLKDNKIMIQIDEVTKYYDSQAALEKVKIHVKKGEMAFVTGPSGAGKTTLFKMLYLYERPDSGSVTIAGFNTVSMKDSSIPILRRNIGVVFQDFKLLTNKTVFENIALALRIRGAHERSIKEKVSAVLKMINLRHKADKYPLTLSGGEQQRVTIARAIVGDPTVMLADEPTGNLDIDNEDIVMKIFKEINARGTTILIATHNVRLYKNSGRTVYFLEDGHLVSVGVG